ncbi:marvel domain-containing protein [Leptodontidium sp. 2 PMI_412]|nr:marvel domain-containing protein [Leptodontidium sp. MPI-SDFR-AT-0119]KAH9215736.1 marvel domain-containing protein [Leptodontidium sp. 2 PMI_412]
MIVTLGLRAAQLVISAVVLALAVVLINGYGPGHGPALLGYGAFCGGAALVIAAVGTLAVFFDRLQGVIMLALDGLASFFLLAGAAAWTAKVKTGDCNSESYILSIASIVRVSDDKTFPGKNLDQRLKNAREFIVARCRIEQAETAVLWILVICFLATIVLAFFGRSGKRGGAMV